MIAGKTNLISSRIEEISFGEALRKAEEDFRELFNFVGELTYSLRYLQQQCSEVF